MTSWGEKSHRDPVFYSNLKGSGVKVIQLFQGSYFGLGYSAARRIFDKVFLKFSNVGNWGDKSSTVVITFEVNPQGLMPLKAF